MLSLKIREQVVTAMIKAAATAAPLEACGLVGGSPDEAVAFYELTNADAAADHFSMLPQEQFAAVKQMRRAGQQMIGVWHSHPGTPARMSAEDLRLAFTPETIYFITSLANLSQPELKGFVVTDGTPEEVELTIVPTE